MTSRADIIKAQESIGNVEITHNQWAELREVGEIALCTKEETLYFAPRDVIYPDENIQSSKIFEDVIKLIDEKLKDYHKRLEDGCLPDLTQANVSGMILGIEDLKSKIKEKWGKI
jgi:hypothetical protein